jgi:hypothetical protein
LSRAFSFLRKRESVIACDKREAFAQGNASDGLSAEALQAKAEAIHPFAMLRDGLLRRARNDA